MGGIVWALRFRYHFIFVACCVVYTRLAFVTCTVEADENCINGKRHVLHRIVIAEK